MYVEKERNTRPSKGFTPKFLANIILLNFSVLNILDFGSVLQFLFSL